MALLSFETRGVTDKPSPEFVERMPRRLTRELQDMVALLAQLDHLFRSSILSLVVTRPAWLATVSCGKPGVYTDKEGARQHITVRCQCKRQTLHVSVQTADIARASRLVFVCVAASCHLCFVPLIPFKKLTALAAPTTPRLATGYEPSTSAQRSLCHSLPMSAMAGGNSHERLLCAHCQKPGNSACKGCLLVLVSMDPF